MPIYDYLCDKCKRIHERIENPDNDDSKSCPYCGDSGSHRIISASGQYCGNQDAAWLKSTTEVVGTETREGREFKANPTRDNYKAWLKVTGLRPLERNERVKPEPKDLTRLNEAVMRAHQKRKSITLRGING